MIRRLILISLIFIAQGIIFLQVSELIREDKTAELQSHLRNVSFLQNSDSLLNITGRLTLIRNRLEKGDSPIDNYQNEARIQSLSSGLNLYGAKGEDGGGKVTERSAMALFADRLLGRDAPDSGSDPEYFAHLEEAYYWERNRHYGLAVDKYRFLLSSYESDIKEPVRQTILLHLSFSHLMNAEYSEAERIAEKIIAESSHMIFRITADRINTFLFSLKKKQQQLTLLEEDSLELGREQYFSVKYREASRTLENYLDKGEASTGEEAEARYYLARAYEELGNTEDSISEYQRILVLSSDESIVAEAGRRLMMLNSFYEISSEEAAVLKEALQDFTDPELSVLIEPFRELYIEPALIPEDRARESESTGRESEESETAKRGEIYITTNPPGAAISVNGINFGISPLFITSLPVGMVTVKADYEEISEIREVEVSERIIRKISIDLPDGDTGIPLEPPTIPRGTLLLDFNLTEVSMELNYKPFTALNGEAVTLDAGEYILIVTGRDDTNTLIFWEGIVTIEGGKRTELSIP